MQILTSLIDRLRQCFDRFPDKRIGKNIKYSLPDIAMAAFSVFFVQSVSFLAHQRRLKLGHGRSNCESLFGITGIPSDNHIRNMLDPARPELLHPVFGEVVGKLEEIGGLARFQRLGNHILIALDGTEYHCSQNVHCPHCSTRQRKGQTEYFHTMLGATIVAPGQDKVVPLQPEFVLPQDGAAKQDCEINAAKRWLAAHAPAYAKFNPIYLGDDLFAHQPFCEAVLAQAADFIFTCKPSSHALIQEYVTGTELPTHQEIVKKGPQRFTHRFRWLHDVPLRSGKDALMVNWFEIEIIDPAGKVTYRNSFITNLPVGPDNVAELAACGRTRWKIENETFNVLKKKGYNFEHNFGHGKQNLSTILVTLNLIAFAFHTVCDIAEALWTRARAKYSSRKQFFDTMAAVTAFQIFSSWHDLLQTLAFEKPNPVPS